MNDLYGCGASTIRKYTNIVCKVLNNWELGIFTTYIYTPTRVRLQDIMERFRNSTRLPNICGAIDRTYILFSCRPNSHLMPMVVDFFNQKKFHNVVL